jgi:ribonuclease J
MSAAAELVFLPLGGSNEIGMNFNLYGYGPPEARKWIIVDLGVTFGDESTPGIDVILPDPSFIEEFADDILGIVLTHAHEDHLGAVAWLWPRLKAPIYATPFTAFLLREKLKQADLLGVAPVREVPLNGIVDLGPFEVTYVTLTHSIPEPNGLAIRTPLGTVLHTGDWKIDPEPLLGATTDVDHLRRLGSEGVLAMVCDSTNVFVEGRAGSEAHVRDSMNALIPTLSGAVAAACFASNVARMDTLIRAGKAAGREVALVGRSMIRMAEAARSVGLLSDVGQLFTDRDIGRIPKERMLYLCTGSQGEPRAALSRIASGDHPHVRLGAGDNCIFSSRIIPGNDLAIRRMQNRLADMGVRIITDDAHKDLHVSGHPCRDELADMYAWARPRIAIPTHGEQRHLQEHLALARTLQVPEGVAPRNGDMVRLAPGPASIIDEVPAGRLYVDGQAVTPELGVALRERRHMAFNGVITVAAVLDDDGRLLGPPKLKAVGLPDGQGVSLSEALAELSDLALEAVDGMDFDDREEDEAVEAALSRAVKRGAFRIWKRRPAVEVSVLRV